MRTLLHLILLLTAVSFAQVNYGTPPEGLIPKALEGIPQALEVMHFPKVNHPVKIDERYYWKHATGVMSNQAPAKIIEYGAYLYYNDQWNLRKKYPLKELKKSFGIKDQALLQGHPYVWTDNWRTDDRLFGGWAMWYFIAETEDGQRVCGFATIHTTDQLLNP
ncbi:hypothetical protein [Gilvibacter sediminis]|uniref:hypothetical protein n=1 Tax=Gilvibacter sediminis TaxID=379071 RepID=UPI002350A1D0|nr:hypothetical protein [Gilvibacter sediminis]MDC7997356.1 hypothetical protein [Gilvibacter sediminis]